MDRALRSTHERQQNVSRVLACAIAHEMGHLSVLQFAPGLPFRFDAKTIRAGLNFTLITSLGDIDLLGEITGGGTS